MYFGIYPEYLVDNIDLSGKKAILIRISDENWHYNLKTEHLYSDVINLNIKDMPIDLIDDKFRENLKLSFFKLNEFILVNDFDEIVVHCGAGQSRSPAIMICIAKMLGSEEMEQIVRDCFDGYNKAIVKEFANYNFVIKDISFKKVIFKGHFFGKIDTNDEINGILVSDVNNFNVPLIKTLKK